MSLVQQGSLTSRRGEAGGSENMASPLGCHPWADVGLRAGKVIIVIDVNRHRSATLPAIKKNPTGVQVMLSESFLQKQLKGGAFSLIHHGPPMATQC